MEGREVVLATGWEFTGAIEGSSVTKMAEGADVEMVTGALVGLICLIQGTLVSPPLRLLVGD
jgi:uncharacterized membrane protein